MPGFVLVGLLTGACDGSVVEPTPHFELAGTYQATMHATTESATLDAAVVLVVEHQDANVTGSYGIIGELVFEGEFAEIEGSGTFTGTVTAADEPALDIVVRTPMCPDYEGPFVGRFNPSTGTLFLGGSVDIFEGGCAVLLRFDVVLLLRQ
ncbi:MAG TPA: hypothetical protein VM198_07325 [Longimicrobiales bacterium]|nr:hypothetical protein [Longimicrobiales bacterium]